MCPAQFGMRHTHTNSLPHRGYGRITRLKLKEKYSEFYLPLVSWLPWCCCMFWQWTLTAISGPDIMDHDEASPTPEGVRLDFRTTSDTWYFSHTNRKKHAVFVLNRRPSTCSTPSLQTHTRHILRSTSHTMRIWTWDHLHGLQLLPDSPYPLHLLFSLHNPSVFPHSVHIGSTAATLSFFLFPFPSALLSPVLKRAFFSMMILKFWSLAILSSTYCWSPQLKPLFPTGAKKMHLPWTFPPHHWGMAQKFFSSLSIITHLLKWILSGSVYILWDNCNLSPLQPIQLWPTTTPIKSSYSFIFWKLNGSISFCKSAKV